jgi:hypothetical protein
MTPEIRDGIIESVQILFEEPNGGIAGVAQQPADVTLPVVMIHT